MVDPKNNGENGDPGQVRADLLAHPLALPAIATTIGMGVASQMLGFWMGALSGTMAGAMQASRRIADEHAPLGGTAADVASLPVEEKPAAARARKAVKKIIAEASEPAEEAATAPVAVEQPAIQAQTETVSSAARDDLKAISGIGPKLEQVLNKLGVSTYAQIAAWTDAEIARIEEHFGFPGRIGRDGWVGQATKFLNERGRK